jgi:hypothetical protein
MIWSNHGKIDADLAGEAVIERSFWKRIRNVTLIACACP